jgi:hypothetical protein
MFGYVQRARWASLLTLGPFTTVVISTFTNGPGNSSIAFTTTTAHGFVANQLVIINGSLTSVSGYIPSFFDGTYTITSVTAFTFTVNANVVFSGAIAGTGGAATVSASGAFNQGTQVTSLKFFSTPTTSNYLLYDTNGRLFSLDSGNVYMGTERFNLTVDPRGKGSSQLNGPWSREILENIVYEMNGQVKQTGRNANAATVESWGLNAPDVSPAVTVSGGSSVSITAITRLNGIVTVTTGSALTVPGGNNVGFFNIAGVTDTSFSGTFVVLTGSGTTSLTYAQTGQNVSSSGGNATTQITKSIGRSYAYAWENANKVHISAPSPATQYFQYTNQTAIINCIEQGTVTFNDTVVVTGTNSSFTQSWVGQYLWAATNPGNFGLIVSVQSATQLTLATPAGTNAGPVSFTIFDPSVTHLRLYYTSDGGATYFRVQRNAFNSSAITVATSGLQFFDSANAEPPAFPYTTEISQLYNIPPPVGSFVKEYQGVLIVYGITGAAQSFFYSNSTLTTIGLQQESFAPLNQVTLPIQNASINGMAETPGALIIWSDKQDMFRLTGLLTDNTSATATQQGATITALPYNLGCASPFAVALTPLGVIWLTANAEVWLFTDSYAPRNIGRPIAQYLKNIPTSQLKNARAAYYHNFNRDWFVLSVSNGAQDDVLLILDLEQLMSNGSPSYFVFDMATNQPVWYAYNLNCPALEVMYEFNGAVRLFTGYIDNVTDVDYLPGNFGTELSVPSPFITLHAWGNDAPQMIKRPTWFRFATNRDPTYLPLDGWTFGVNGIDDDFYTFQNPISLQLVPGVNDASTLGGNPNLSNGSPFRHSPELYKIGGVNFVMGRRLQLNVVFPTSPGADYQLRQVQIGFGPSPPR